MEEKEGDDGDDGSGWRNISVFVMSLSQNISFRDETLLSGRIYWTLTLTWFVHLIYDRAKLILILVLEVLFSDSMNEVGVGTVLDSH